MFRLASLCLVAAAVALCSNSAFAQFHHHGHFGGHGHRPNVSVGVNFGGGYGNFGGYPGFGGYQFARPVYGYVQRPIYVAPVVPVYGNFGGFNNFGGYGGCGGGYRNYGYSRGSSIFLNF